MAGKKIISILKNEGLNCLPCEKINLDIDRYFEYRDSEEHPGDEPFENPPLKLNKKPIKEIKPNDPSILRFFLDGSRRTYKVADVVIDGHYLPIVAGQVGVATIKRNETDEKLSVVRKYCEYQNVIAFPSKMSVEDLTHFRERIKEILGLEFEVLQYSTKQDSDPVDLAVAEIMSLMQKLEIDTVSKIAEDHMLSNNNVLILDGSLRFRKKLDLIQFRNVFGLSKTFKPSFKLGKGRRSEEVGTLTSGLSQNERSSVYKTFESKKTIGMWYLRIRPPKMMTNPLQGVVKIEGYAIDPEEIERGLDSQRVDIISGYIIRERNVTPYHSDPRWASHIYPIYLAETYLKNTFMSNIHFQGLF